MSNVTFEQAFSKAFAHIGAALDIFQSIPRPNGATTKVLSNGHGAAAKALPAPSKVKVKAAKALPPAPALAAAPAAETKPAKPVKAKAAAKAKPVKAKAAAKSKAIVKAKPAKAPKAAKAKADKGAAANAISEGRRAVANGDRPKLVDAIAIVMGDETLTAGTILERLTARGWQPGASSPQSYISFTLSSNVDTFKRGKRGEYAVKNPKKFEEVAAQFKSGKPAAAAAPKAAKAAKAPKAAKAKGAGSKKSGKAEGVASTDAGAVEAATTQEPEAAPAEVVAEAAPVAGDPPTSTPDATTAPVSSESTTKALEGLGMGAAEIGENPFDALN